MKAPNCPFCDTENIALTLDPANEWYRVRSRLLSTTGGVSLCAGLGAIVEPYMICFTQDHFKAVAELPANLRSDLFDSLDKCLGSGFFPSRSICVFEHSGGSRSGDAACVEHCHLHIVDGKYDFRREFAMHFPKAEKIEISEQGGFNFQPGYLLAGIYTGNRVISGLKSEKPNCGSQFIRRLLADKVGSITWNWRTHPTPDAASELCARWRNLAKSGDKKLFDFRNNLTKSPRFSEMNKVRVNDRENEPYEGYVIDSQFRDGRWIYKLSISEDPTKSETYDNWLPEEWLELTK